MIAPRRRSAIAVVARWRFLAGLFSGLLLLLACRLAINRTPIADWLVAPLLLTETTGRADAIVVLGAGVIRDCVPNNFAVRRTLLATRLWRDARAPYVLFTGGPGVDTCPVAESMAGLARDLGIPEDRIVLEPMSHSTYENGVYAAPLLRQRGSQRVLLVTDRLHMRRAAGVFTRLGFDVGRASVPVYEGHADNVEMLAAGLREYVALLYYWARGRMAAFPAPGLPPPASPVEPQQSPMSSHPSSFGSRSFVIIGASYARGWKLPTVAGMPVVNRGVDGQQSVDLLERFERDGLADRPHAVLIWGFINDLFRQEAFDADAVAQRVIESYAQMIRAARREGVEPVIATEVTIRSTDSVGERLLAVVGPWFGKTAYQDRINQAVVTINHQLRAISRQHGCLLLDFESVLAEPGRGSRRRAFAQPDGSHITVAGYDALSGYAVPLLAAHFANILR